MSAGASQLGLAGRLTRAFITSPLTPLFLLASLRARPRRAVTLPREEEPQISVPMVDIACAPTASRRRTPSSSSPSRWRRSSSDQRRRARLFADRGRRRHGHGALPRRHLADAAILRVHEKLRANMDRIPVGIPEPLIVGRGIDDVAIVVADAGAEAGARRPLERQRPDARGARAAVEVAKLDDVGLTYIVGEQPEEIRVEPDPAKLARYGVTLQQLAAKVAGRQPLVSGRRVRDGGSRFRSIAGQTLQGLPRSATCC
jgi:hypothetical protein